MPPPRRTRWSRWPLLALIALLVLLAVGYTANAVRGHGVDTRPGTAIGHSSGPVALSTLPIEARRTVDLIRAGGPFPFARDGAVFGNVEGRLPARARGFYHEYTVPTPGSPDRGARRIITGGAGEFYYTADHYQSIVLVDVSR